MKLWKKGTRRKGTDFLRVRAVIYGTNSLNSVFCVGYFLLTCKNNWILYVQVCVDAL